MKLPNFLSRIHPLVLTVILLSLLYWSYLGMTSQVIIFHDSIGYQKLGNMLAHEPWVNYFKTGPNREPLYPLLISFSIRLAKMCHADYVMIQTFLQIMILVFTQLLTAILLTKLRVSTLLTAMTLAYLGFSPTFVNSGLILFSEVIAYPLIVWLTLQCAKAWNELRTAGPTALIRNGAGLALSALLITLTKGIFEIIVPLLLFPFLLRFIKGNPNDRRRIGIVVVTALLGFYLPLNAYKALNKTYNGVYTLTDRGPVALYGNTARRMLPLDAARLKAAIAYIPGAEVCAHFYSAACDQWGFLPADILASEKNSELIRQFKNPAEVNKALVKASLEEALKNPFQYVFLMGVEAVKILFWEGQEIYCVVYPSAIDTLYTQTWLRYGLRFGFALLSVMAMILVFGNIIRNKRELCSTTTIADQTGLKFYLLLVIVVYTIFASMFYITARYAQPMIPLFLALIASAIEDLTAQKR